MTQIEKQAELLPCPMCNGDAKYGKFDVTPDAIKAVHDLYYHFACTSCGLATAECEYTTIEQAAEAWNTRAPTARERELEKVIAQQDKLLKAAYDCLQSLDESLYVISNMIVEGKTMRHYSNIAIIARGRATEAILKTGLYFDGYVEK